MQWLLLLHQIPPKPPYFRAKILRRMNQLGALAVKNSAYLLPDTEETREDFEWVRREIADQGGAAWLFQADAVSGFEPGQLVQAFRDLRTRDYEELVGAAEAFLGDETSEAELGRILQRAEEVRRIDFFGHPLGERLEVLLHRIQERSRPGTAGDGVPPVGGVWVTRRGIKVDRIGSAWLIRRFIDPNAQFRFVDNETYRHTEPEIRFDMYEGEFTHEGELCTFEVLMARYQLGTRHAGLLPIAEMIHDLDLKDERHQRPETAGLARMLEGLCARTDNDLERLAQGASIFDALFESFRR